MQYYTRNVILNKAHPIHVHVCYYDNNWMYMRYVNVHIIIIITKLSKLLDAIHSDTIVLGSFLALTCRHNTFCKNSAHAHMQ